MHCPVILADFSADNPTMIKVLWGLCLAILHLYWQAYRCKERHADSRERLSKVETQLEGEKAATAELRQDIARCPQPACLLRSGPPHSPAPNPYPA